MFIWYYLLHCFLSYLLLSDGFFYFHYITAHTEVKQQATAKTDLLPKLSYFHPKRLPSPCRHPYKLWSRELIQTMNSTLAGSFSLLEMFYLLWNNFPFALESLQVVGSNIPTHCRELLVSAEPHKRSLWALEVILALQLCWRGFRKPFISGESGPVPSSDTEHGASHTALALGSQEMFRVQPLPSLKNRKKKKKTSAQKS